MTRLEIVHPLGLLAMARTRSYLDSCGCLTLLLYGNRRERQTVSRIPLHVPLFSKSTFSLLFIEVTFTYSPVSVRHKLDIAQFFYFQTHDDRFV